MPERDLLAEGVDLLSREALYIDMRRWEEWIDLYHEDAIFWAPAWRNDEELTGQIADCLDRYHAEHPEEAGDAEPRPQPTRVQPARAARPDRFVGLVAPAICHLTAHHTIRARACSRFVDDFAVCAS